MKVILINKISNVKEKVREWKKQNLKIGLVPTMGALHNGHSSLIKKAKEYCDKVIVSDFVNPIQFGPNEDYDKYPRIIDNDIEVCEDNGADILFAPTPDEMYGKGQLLSNNTLTFVCPPYNYVDKLCGKSRIGHFDGVCTVVMKLFNIAEPDYAFFGQKDAQQLFIIKKMVNDLNLNVSIISCPIIREEDGLALSSRNKYLDSSSRMKALSISKALFYIKKLYEEKNVDDTEILFESAISVLDKDIELDYLEFVKTSDLESVNKINGQILVAIAVKVGNVRLIDNIILNE